MNRSLQDALAQLSEVVLGKEEQVRLSVACLLARGHLLVEDLPGMGKTTLAHALARVFSLDYRRVQFTSDMLPADILGVSVYDPNSQQFRVKKGPVFTQLLLADEVNRATPKTQSALLEAMEERQVTLDGVTRGLPEPFFVVATQNPVTQTGTFPLPESQLDRFLMRISLGYPAAAVERDLLSGLDRREYLASLEPSVGVDTLIQLCGQVDRVHASEELIDYIQRLLAHSRACGDFIAGLSPRAGLGLLRAARAWALVAERDYVIPEDVQAVLEPVCEHRLQSAAGGPAGGGARQLLEAVAVTRGG
jgi:MoxR-like ATPase